MNSSRLRPGFIGFKKDTVILPGRLIIPCFGQTLPEFKATGTQEIFKASYILPTPFLKGILSSNFTLVPWGNIRRGLFSCLIIFATLSKKLRLSFVVVSLIISIDLIFFK